MATKQIEKNIISEDDKEIIYEIITKVISDDGREDIYRDKYVEPKSESEAFQTEHESFHSSGLHNNDHLGDKKTTHVHERSDGSTDIFDTDKNGDDKDRTPYESSI